MSKVIKPINLNGIKSFLVEAFGDNYNEKVTPNSLAKKLFNYKDVGEVACQRRFSKKSDSLQVTEKTNFQLIAANIVRVKVDTNGDKPLLHCMLSFDTEINTQRKSTHMHTHYPIKVYWENMFECNED